MFETKRLQKQIDQLNGIVHGLKREAETAKYMGKNCTVIADGQVNDFIVTHVWYNGLSGQTLVHYEEYPMFHAGFDVKNCVFKDPEPVKKKVILKFDELPKESDYAKQPCGNHWLFDFEKAPSFDQKIKEVFKESIGLAEKIVEKTNAAIDKHNKEVAEKEVEQSAFDLINKICEVSLSPEQLKKWISVKTALKKVRKSLK